MPSLTKPLVVGGLWAFSSALDAALRASIERQHRAYWRDITAPPFSGVPTLVLFSRRDGIVKHPTVLRYVELAAADVRAVEFHGSSHVDHILVHPETYAREVGCLLRRVGGTASKL